MEKPISAGDLVVVVKPTICCGRSDGVGRILTVLGDATNSMTRCAWCNDRRSSVDEVLCSDAHVAERSRLKRIPPFPELKDERHDEEITA